MGRRRIAFACAVAVAAFVAVPAAAHAAVDYAAYNRLADAVWAAQGDRCSRRAQVQQVELIDGDEGVLGSAVGVWDDTCVYLVRRDLSAYEACVITVHERGHLAGYEPVYGVDAWHDRAGLMSTNPVDWFPDPRQNSGRPPYELCARLVRVPLSRELAEDAVARKWPVRTLTCRVSAGVCVGTTPRGRRLRWTVRYDARWSVVARRR